MHRDLYARYARPARRCCRFNNKALCLFGLLLVALLVLLICAPCWLIVLIACAIITGMCFYFTKWKHKKIKK